jgi:hypothetical protein
MSEWSEERFEGNLAALRARDADLADRVERHRGEGRGEGLPCRLSAEGARQVVSKLCPTGACADSILVAGIDKGWLWGMLYELPVSVPLRPGFRPPIWFLARSVEEFWVALHVHDWRGMLGDARVRLFVGEDAVEQARRSMLENPQTPLPRLSVTVDPGIWPAGVNLDALGSGVTGEMSRRLEGAMRNLEVMYGSAPQAELRNNFRELRVLGITARYTTFLQHSMRDWLAAFEGMGHETKLLIEGADHEQLNSLCLAEACVEFRPDLILLIDHFRAELGGLPENVPCVMWLQDYLPNLFSAGAGAAQGRYDYVVGYNRTECTTRFGYPFERFMPAMVAVNEQRFAPVELSAEDRRRYECDVCFVSHASKPAEEIIADQIAQNDASVTPLLKDAFERLRSIYEAGLCVSHPLHVRQVIDEAMVAKRTPLAGESAQRLADVFTHRINNALLRHQMIDWAAETGVSIHLYGNGWERHPRFARFAKGPADNTTELRKIFGAARISLQATPHGAVHQRLLEGLAAGGFFLIRYVPGDMIERIYQPLWQWCVEEGIESDEYIQQRATPEVWKMLGQLQRTLGIDPFKLGMRLVDDLRTGADTGWLRSAAAVWPEQYDAVAFDSKGMMRQKISRFLGDEAERRRLAGAMRRVVVERLTYRAVNERLLRFGGGFGETRVADGSGGVMDWDRVAWANLFARVVPEQVA